MATEEFVLEILKKSKNPLSAQEIFSYIDSSPDLFGTAASGITLQSIKDFINIELKKKGFSQIKRTKKGSVKFVFNKPRPLPGSTITDKNCNKKSTEEEYAVLKKELEMLRKLLKDREEQIKFLRTLVPKIK